MAEIARAGILSVDKGQIEAAHALGMPPGRTMRRIVLPQAMRVIVPPTGNETIAMVKDTSLFIAASIIAELYFQAYGFGQRSFQIVPGFMAATLWYLIVCSILMVGPVLPRALLRTRHRRTVQGSQTQDGADHGGSLMTTDATPDTPDAPASARRRTAPPAHPARRRPAAYPWSTPSTSPRPSTATRSSRASTWTSTQARWSACSAPRARARRRSCGASTSSRRSTAAGSGSTAT